MASASTTEVFPCSVEQLYNLITDYESYPLFLDEVKDLQIIEDQGDKKLVEYTVHVVKKFKYKLWMDHSIANEVHWSFAGGDIFKKMQGSWKLEDEAGQTRAHYEVSADFGIFVPSPITKGLISANLPNMMSSFKARIKEVYG
tara:strand:+ start:26346 stop:26774 length:429 start_codon:yes stop_codon:yes gene_type:complete